jgi:hypothetical protein
MVNPALPKIRLADTALPEMKSKHLTWSTRSSQAHPDIRLANSALPHVRVGLTSQALPDILANQSGPT